MAGYLEALVTRKGRIATLFSILACAFFSCGFFFSDPADTVKDGYMAFDESTTVGAALENYEFIKSSKWSVQEDKQKRKIVQFEGIIDQEKIARYFLGSHQIFMLSLYGLHEPAKLQAAINNKNNSMYTTIWTLLIQFRIEKNGDFFLSYIGIRNPDGKDEGLSEAALDDVYNNRILMTHEMGRAWGK